MEMSESTMFKTAETFTAVFYAKQSTQWNLPNVNNEIFSNINIEAFNLSINWETI